MVLKWWSSNGGILPHTFSISIEKESNEQLGGLPTRYIMSYSVRI